MKKELFEELVESIKEGGKILKGRAKPKRAFKYDELDVRRLIRFAAIEVKPVGTNP